MKFIVYDNAHDFERKIESFLLEKEDVFSLFGEIGSPTSLSNRK